MKRKWLLIIALVTAIFSLQLITTFGLFESSSDISMEADLAKFKISINDSEINNENISFDVDTFNYVTDSEVAPGKFAPNGEVYFDIVIDPGETDVSFRYDITLDFSNIENEQITFESIKIDDTSLTRTDEYTYSGIFLLEDITEDENDDITVRVTLKWENDDNNTEVDNDTMESGDIEVPVSIHLIQYLGETLTTYTPLEEEQNEGDSTE